MPSLLTSYVLVVRRASLPQLGPELPRSGGPLSRRIGELFLGLLGWHIEGELPNIRKLVVIAAPHTSNWDFAVGIAARFALGVKVMFLGKDTLFRFPLGPIIRAWGGVPVDRTHPSAVVNAMVEAFAHQDRLVLALAPEGTRKPVTRWRTGFYHIAHGAGVPIVPVALNFDQRAIQIGVPFVTTGDLEGDMALLQTRFATVRGKRTRPMRV